LDLKEFKRELKNLNKFASFEQEAPAQVVAETQAAPSDEMDIDQYASDHAMSKSEVWNLIKQGKLVGRQVRGKILIQTEGISAEDLEKIEENNADRAHVSIAPYGQSTPSLQAVRLPELKFAGDQPTELGRFAGKRLDQTDFRKQGIIIVGLRRPHLDAGFTF